MLRRKDNEGVFLGWLLGIAAVCCYHSRMATAAPTELLNLPFTSSGEKERVIMFDLLPSERCNFGDLDAILNDLRNGDDQLRLQLSVEAIGAKVPTVIFGAPLEKKVSEKNLGTYQVRLPTPTEGTMYGVFLCTVKADQLSKAPCSSQTLLPFDEVMKSYTVTKGQAYVGSTETKPKVYFAQFMTGNGASFSALRAAGGVVEGSDLERVGISKGTMEETLPIIKKFSSALGSLPLETAEERVQLVLPFFSDKKCNFNAPKK